MPSSAMHATSDIDTGAQLVIMSGIVRFSTPTGLVGRGVGLLTAEGPAPAVTAVLLTPRDSRADWLRAGQALHRLLLHAAQ